MRAMGPALADALAACVGRAVIETRRVPGGDINEAFEARLDDGSRLFVKTHVDAPPRMFQREARGLRWLREANALRVPEVIAVAEATEHHPAFLVLELIASRARRATFEADLGRGLALLHRAGAPGFGFDEDNFIGRLPQPNTPASTWAAFYGEQRLLVQVRTAVDSGRAPRSWIARVDDLIARLPTLVGRDEAPARLHGDLWSGNVISDERGAPVIIDPAAYGGHREVDLAMLRLFGSPGPRVFDAYGEVWPLEPGHEERVQLYQLYPLLVHVNLFGGSYVHAADGILRAYA
jgi:fructosamine-3-kinase